MHKHVSANRIYTIQSMYLHKNAALWMYVCLYMYVGKQVGRQRRVYVHVCIYTYGCLGEACTYVHVCVSTHAHGRVYMV